MAHWLSFAELLALPSVVALASAEWSDGGAPDQAALFIAATTAVLPVLPEGALLAPLTMGAGGPNKAEALGTASSGACVFYVQQLDGGEPTGAYDPWTLEVFLGGSSSYTFSSLDGGRVLHESDSEPWQQATQALLAGSLWRVLQAPGL